MWISMFYSLCLSSFVILSIFFLFFIEVTIYYVHGIYLIFHDTFAHTSYLAISRALVVIKYFASMFARSHAGIGSPLRNSRKRSVT